MGSIRSIVIVVALVVALPLFCVRSDAADYQIGIQDVLQINFWQDPSLNQAVVVRDDGKITVSIIGDIAAAGLTTSELAQKIGDRANFYNPQVSQATVTVTAYNSKKVFISGQVLQPGPYALERLPNAWELIKQAGGVTEFADLSRVTLIRGSEKAGEIITIDVDRLVGAGQFDRIPKLNPGDIVEVPRMPGGIPGTGLPKELAQRENVVFVTGAIARSGVVSIESEMDVLEAIVRSGGASPDADLRKVKIISKHSDYPSVMTINLEKYTESGVPRQYVLKPEDTVVLPRRSTSAFRVGWGTFRDIVAVSASIISTYVLIDRVNR